MPLHPGAGAGQVAVGAEVQLTSDVALAFQLARGHGGWAPPMADCLGRNGIVVDVVNAAGDVRINCGEFGSYVWNPAAIVNPSRSSSEPSVLAVDLHPRRLYASASSRGRCSLCRRDLNDSNSVGAMGEDANMSADNDMTLEELAKLGTEESTADLEVREAAECIDTDIAAKLSASGAAEDGDARHAVVFSSRDAAFRLCASCAEPYREASTWHCPTARDSSTAPAPLDCPGRHGLCDVATTGSASCDVCSASVANGAMLRACRTCNWGICMKCVSEAPNGVQPPALQVGMYCRADRNNKPQRAVILDRREVDADGAEVLLHFPGQTRGSSDEWVKITSHRLVPIDPPAAGLQFHPAHHHGLVLAPMPNYPEAGPKCTAEVKFPGGCRRHWDSISASCSPHVGKGMGLFCERTQFFLCPWCTSVDLAESTSSADGAMAARRADVAALRDPQRRSDAATRVAKQCSRSVYALVGLLGVGLLEALADALASHTEEPLPPALLSLFLAVVEWLFRPCNEALQVGDRVLFESAPGAWSFARVAAVDAGKSDKKTRSYSIQWSASSASSAGSAVGVTSDRLHKLATLDMRMVDPESRQLLQMASKRPAARHGVPPPATLSKDFLMKKAIPSDNTAQARQYLIDGADLHACSESGDGVLVLAVEHGCSVKMIRLLLEFGCPISAGATLGEPLQLAARYGQLETMELLLDARADPSTLCVQDLPQGLARRIAPYASLLSIGGREEELAKIGGVNLVEARGRLAQKALPPLAHFLAKPPNSDVEDEFGSAVDIEALLKALDALLAANGQVSAGAACLSDLVELMQRLMTSFAPAAARHAVLLIRRLLRAGEHARQELQRCGVIRFLEGMASGQQTSCNQLRSPVAAMPPQGHSGSCTRSMQDYGLQVDGETALADLAADVLKELSDVVPSDTDASLGQNASKIQSLAAQLQDRRSCGKTLSELAQVLQGCVSPGGDPSVTAYELEVAGVPQALLAFLEADSSAGAALVHHLGDAGIEVLIALLLRLVENTETLPIRPLPPYLSQASGLRILSEPLLLVLLRGQGLADSSKERELEKQWLQVEPLVTVQALERVVLLTSPVLDKAFLEWCVSLVGQDVAPCSESGILGDTYGRVVHFRLVPPLYIGVHTIQRASDGVEVDLVASVHGLVPVDGMPPQPTGADIRVALLRLEAWSSSEECSAVISTLQSALCADGVVSQTDAVDCATRVPLEAGELLNVMGFKPIDGREGQWCHQGDKASTAAALEAVLDQRKRIPVCGSGGDLPGIEPDPALVYKLAEIWGENGARRACLAVNNSSEEAAMTWACEHQGDADFSDPLPELSSRGCSADPRAAVWSVFIVLPPGVPFELVWEMIEDSVKGALTSVANAWTAIGWAGGESEMRETLRAQVAATGEGSIARGLPRAKAERVANRLRSACECRVSADPEGAASAPRGRAAASSSNGLPTLGARVQLVLEAELLGIVVGVAPEGGIDVVADDGQLRLNLPLDQVRTVSRGLSTAAGAGPDRARSGPLQPTMQGGANDGSWAATSVAEPVSAPPIALVQSTFESFDKGAPESDVIRRLQPSDLLPAANGQAGNGGTVSSGNVHDMEAQGRKASHPVPRCRVAFGVVEPAAGGVDRQGLHLLRGERSMVKADESGQNFSSTCWLTVGFPGLSVGSGSWYYEIKLTRLKNPQVGWADAAFRLLIGPYCDDGIGDDVSSWAADGERCCLWHRGKYGDWRSAVAGQTMCCAISISGSGLVSIWFAVDGQWDTASSFKGMKFDSYLYPAVSGELDASFNLHAHEMTYAGPDPSFRPIGEAVTSTCLMTPTASASSAAKLPKEWTVLRGLYSLSDGRLPAAPIPLVLQTEVQVSFEQGGNEGNPASGSSHRSSTSLLFSGSVLQEGKPLHLSSGVLDNALVDCGLKSDASRAALRVLRNLQAVPSVAGAVVKQVNGGDPALHFRLSLDNHRRLGAKIQSHLAHALACCAGAFPRWCRELPVLAPWLFPLEAREAILRCSAFGVAFGIRWLQEQAVDERFAERRRSAEERLSQAKHIGDPILLNNAWESLFELQGQIAKDAEVWVGLLKSEIARVERDRILDQAERALELTCQSRCALEVQFESESGFGRGVTQGFYTLVAHELQRRTTNREVPMWVEEDPPLAEESLRLRRGLMVQPLAPDDARLPQVERRFRMLGRLMAKALREGFVVPLPLTSAFFQQLLGGDLDLLEALPGPGDAVAGEFIGACAAMIVDADRVGDEGAEVRLREIAADPEWSRKYMQPPGEEQMPASPFEAFASVATFQETGLKGAELCPGGASKEVSVDNVREFVKLAAEFWLGTGIQRQFIAFRKGLHDVLGDGAAALWAFGPAELRRLCCGEDEVVWTEKDLAEHLHCGGGYTSETEQVRWLREELLAMAPPLRSKFLDFVTSCPRLPPGGLKELKLSVYPDPAHVPGLPRSRACSHRLFLPKHASREELSRQLHEAILCSGGHHEQQLPM